MKEFIGELASNVNDKSTLSKLAITLLLFLIAYIIKKGIRTFMNKIDLDSNETIKYKKTSSIILNIVVIIIIIPVWMDKYKNLFTFLGIFSAGLAFAFRDVVASFMGWIIIISQKPFKIGDRIRIGETLGDVLEINWFHTTIIEVVKNEDKTYGQSTGRLVYIPNMRILTDPLTNETNSFPYVWNEINISITLDSNWSKAKELLLNSASNKLGNITEEAKDSLNVVSKTLPIYYDNLSHTVYTSVEQGRIVLTLRFICRSRNFRNFKHSIIEDILTEFSKHKDIKLL